MQRKLVVGIDIDDTLTDHYTQCVLDGREFVTKYLHREPDKFDANQMHTKDMYGLSDEEEIKYNWRYWKKQIETAPVAEYVQEVMPELYKEYEIHIVTARGMIWKVENPYLSAEEEKNMTLDWLEKNHIPYHHIHFGVRDKGQYCQNHGIDVLVDNDPKYVNTCKGTQVIPIIPLKPYTIKSDEFDEKRTLLIRDFQDLQVLLHKIEEFYDKREEKLGVTTEAYELVDSEFEDEKPVINNKTWFVSDLHLGKPNAGCGKDYYETINRRVKEKDTLIICGDIGFRKDENRIQKLSDFFRKVNCKHMFLVLGNHDIDDIKLYRAMGFKGVYRKIITPKYVITHEPISVKGGVINIHGHIHMERVYANNVDWHNHINCFWRLCGGPRRLEDLLVMMKNGKFEGRTIDDERTTKIPTAETIKLESSINEDAIYDKTHKYPVFIVLMHTGTNLANLIKKFTRDEFSHSAISLNPSLTPMYSFGRKKPDITAGTGFSISGPNDEFFKIYKSVYSVYVMYMDKAEITRLSERLQWFIDHDDELSYDNLSLVFNLIHLPFDVPKKKWFCSRFVAEVINSGRAINRSPSLWRPQDFTGMEDITLVNSGADFRLYNKNKTLANLKLIQQNRHSDIVIEGALDSEERNALGDNAFGLPRQRKYPLHDKAHVMDAIRKFNYCERQYEAELAHNITRAMKKYKISTSVIGDRNRLLSYIDF